MRPEDVPQDALPYYQHGRKAIYAASADGRFLTVASSGWSVEDSVTAAAADEYRRLAEDALLRARRGEASPLEFHMYARRMDLPQLADSAQLWKWRVRRHFRPAVFLRLKPGLLQRYADALGMPPAELIALPLENPS